MALKLNENVLEGEITWSEGEIQPKWVRSQQGYLYIEKDPEADKDNFFTNIVKCKVDKNSLINYLNSCKYILGKYSAEFKDRDLSTFNENLVFFEETNINEIYIQMFIGQGNQQDHLKILNGRDKRKLRLDTLEDSLVNYGSKLRKTLVGSITRVKFEKGRNNEITLYAYLSSHWRDKIMAKYLNSIQDSAIDIFKQEMTTNMNEHFSEIESAKIFGIKYAPMIVNNNVGLEALVQNSTHNNQGIKEAIEEGMKLSPSIIWHEVEDKPENDDQKGEYIPPEYQTGILQDLDRNRIIFGAPGTGKSYKLKEESSPIFKNNLERVTFHPDYTYASFVGTYKPIKNSNDEIDYEYVPGPFMRTYVSAIKSGKEPNPQPFLLLIEEINRANVAAVFGDAFQLLDRNEQNFSVYPIHASEDVKRYLADELGGKPSNYSTLCIPDNMFIWATMNSADQGVFPLDTAFKRRWNFTYIGIDESEENVKNRFVVLGTQANARRVEWNELRKAINDFLLANNINEDKLLGPYFIDKKILEAGENEPNTDEFNMNRDTFVKTFKSKVLMYLFDDAAKQKRGILFNLGARIPKYSDICNLFDSDGVFIFNPDISTKCCL